MTAVGQLAPDEDQQLQSIVGGPSAPRTRPTIPAVLCIRPVRPRSVQAWPLPSPPSLGVYRIPYVDGTSVKVTNDHLSHYPPGPIDLNGLGSEPLRVVAAAARVVRFMEDGFSEKRPGGSPCNNNYVWIEHANGEWTKYSHMRKNSVGVDAGLDVGDPCSRQFLGIQSDVGCARASTCTSRSGCQRTRPTRSKPTEISSAT